MIHAASTATSSHSLPTPQPEALTVSLSASYYNHDLFKALIAPPIKKTSLKLKKRMQKQRSSKGGP